MELAEYSFKMHLVELEKILILTLAPIRYQNGIALPLAASGIAATLLESGRTAHSGLKLPLKTQPDETPTFKLVVAC